MKAFLTGHRSFSMYYRPGIEKLISAVLYEYDIEGIYCGMAMGFDLIAANELMNQGIKVFAVIPFKNQTERWTRENKKRYERILKLCTTKTILNEHYREGCLFDRNLWMIKRSQLCISAWDGRTKGGTYHAINHSKHMNRVNLNLESNDIEFVDAKFNQLSLF